MLFSRILSALRAVYTAPFISVQFILYMQKRNVLSKSFLFVCRLFYFSNFSITHVCVFVFLSQTRICRVHSNARVPPSSSHHQAQKTSRRPSPKLATTSSTGGLLLALQRAIVTIRPKGRYRKHFCWPAIKRYYSNLLVSILLLALLYTFELLHLLYCQSFQHNIL